MQIYFSKIENYDMHNWLLTVHLHETQRTNATKRKSLPLPTHTHIIFFNGISIMEKERSKIKY